MISVYITCANRKEARKIVRALIQAKLVACANFWPIESVYRWQGKIVQDKEVAILAKAPWANFTKIERLVKKLHSYEIPLIVGWRVSRANKEYLEWLAAGKKVRI